MVWDAGCLLGESPVWCSDTGTLYFVDIKGDELLRWSGIGSASRYPLSIQTGAIALAEVGGLVAAQETGFGWLIVEPWSESSWPLPYPERAGNRFNDGKCDAAGRFWAASMDDACIAPTGNIWSLSPDGTMRCHGGEFIVGNGFGWSSDNRLMYFTDSENRHILVYDFDLANGDIGNPRIFAVVAPECGYPDGLVVDAEDHVWSAHWDGGRITRYRPDGSVERVIKMPVPRPTSLAFGCLLYTSPSPRD